MMQLWSRTAAGGDVRPGVGQEQPQVLLLRDAQPQDDSIRCQGLAMLSWGWVPEWVGREAG